MGSLSVPGDAIVEGNFNNEGEAAVDEWGGSISCELPGDEGAAVMEMKVSMSRELITFSKAFWELSGRIAGKERVVDEGMADVDA